MFNRVGSFGLDLVDFCAKIFSKKNCKKLGFTLTETLLSLVIIGVIAVLVLPAVTTRAQNNAFDVSYNSQVKNLLNSFEMLPVVENKPSIEGTMMVTAEDLDDFGTTSGAFINKYMKVSKYCGNGPGECFASEYITYNENGKKEAYAKDNITGACAALKNGVSICMRPAKINKNQDDQDGNSIIINGYLDLNGKKGPNVYGRDLRSFMIDTKAKAAYNAEAPEDVIILDSSELPACDSDSASTIDCQGPEPKKDCTGKVDAYCCDKSRHTITDYNDPCCRFSNDEKCDKCGSWNTNPPAECTKSCSEVFRSDCCQKAGFKDTRCCADSKYFKENTSLCCSNSNSVQCCLAMPNSLIPGSKCCQTLKDNDPTSALYKNKCISACDADPTGENCCKEKYANGILATQIKGPGHACCNHKFISDRINKCCTGKYENDNFVRGTCCWVNPAETGGRGGYRKGCCYGANVSKECCKNHFDDLSKAQKKYCCQNYTNDIPGNACDCQADGKNFLGEDDVSCCKADSNSRSKYCCDNKLDIITNKSQCCEYYNKDDILKKGLGGVCCAGDGIMEKTTSEDKTCTDCCLNPSTDKSDTCCSASLVKNNPTKLQTCCSVNNQRDNYCCLLKTVDSMSNDGNDFCCDANEVGKTKTLQDGSTHQTPKCCKSTSKSQYCCIEAAKGNVTLSPNVIADHCCNADNKASFEANNGTCGKVSIRDSRKQCTGVNELTTTVDLELAISNDKKTVSLSKYSMYPVSLRYNNLDWHLNYVEENGKTGDDRQVFYSTGNKDDGTYQETGKFSSINDIIKNYKITIDAVKYSNQIVSISNAEISNSKTSYTLGSGNEYGDYSFEQSQCTFYKNNEEFYQGSCSSISDNLCLNMTSIGLCTNDSNDDWRNPSITGCCAMQKNNPDVKDKWRDNCCELPTYKDDNQSLKEEEFGCCQWRVDNEKLIVPTSSIEQRQPSDLDQCCNIGTFAAKYTVDKDKSQCCTADMVNTEGDTSGCCQAMYEYDTDSTKDPNKYSACCKNENFKNAHSKEGDVCYEAPNPCDFKDGKLIDIVQCCASNFGASSKFDDSQLKKSLEDQGVDISDRDDIWNQICCNSEVLNQTGVNGASVPDKNAKTCCAYGAANGYKLKSNYNDNEGTETNWGATCCGLTYGSEVGESGKDAAGHHYGDYIYIDQGISRESSEDDGFASNATMNRICCKQLGDELTIKTSGDKSDKANYVFYNTWLKEQYSQAGNDANINNYLCPIVQKDENGKFIGLLKDENMDTYDKDSCLFPDITYDDQISACFVPKIQDVEECDAFEYACIDGKCEKVFGVAPKSISLTNFNLASSNISFNDDGSFTLPDDDYLYNFSFDNKCQGSDDIRLSYYFDDGKYVESHEHIDDGENTIIEENISSDSLKEKLANACSIFYYDENGDLHLKYMGSDHSKCCDSRDFLTNSAAATFCGSDIADTSWKCHGVADVQAAIQAGNRSHPCCSSKYLQYWLDNEDLNSNDNYYTSYPKVQNAMLKFVQTCVPMFKSSVCKSDINPAQKVYDIEMGTCSRLDEDYIIDVSPQYYYTGSLLYSPKVDKSLGINDNIFKASPQPSYPECGCSLSLRHYGAILGTTNPNNDTFAMGGGQVPFIEGESWSTADDYMCIYCPMFYHSCKGYYAKDSDGNYGNQVLNSNCGLFDTFNYGWSDMLVLNNNISKKPLVGGLYIGYDGAWHANYGYYFYNGKVKYLDQDGKVQSIEINYRDSLITEKFPLKMLKYSFNDEFWDVQNAFAFYWDGNGGNTGYQSKFAELFSSCQSQAYSDANDVKRCEKDINTLYNSTVYYPGESVLNSLATDEYGVQWYPTEMPTPETLANSPSYGKDYNYNCFIHISPYPGLSFGYCFFADGCTINVQTRCERR